MQDNLDYHYFAFISYSSKDKKAAKRIHHKIEGYKLPTVLRNELEANSETKYPQRVTPLFWDMTDLPPALLKKSILRELEDSRYLLLICTPNSAKSEWVNREVENFILMGRYERVIPYIIEGTPNSGDPNTECFPPILRKNREFISYSDWSEEKNAEHHAKLHAILDGIDDELKGVAISGEGARISRLKVIARMLEVSPDTLIQRDKERQKKRIFWSSVTALFFAALFTCLGLWTWDRYFRVHTGYFASYVEHMGVPKGIFPLTKKQWEHRREHYRIYTQNQKVIRLEHVNSAGVPYLEEDTELQESPMIATYYYKRGQLNQKDILDKNGKIIASHLYSGNNLEKMEFRYFTENNESFFKGVSNVTREKIFNPLEPTLANKNNVIGNKRLEWNSDGLLTKELFRKGIYDIPAIDEQGIAGFQYKRDEFGRIIEKTYLGLDEEPHPDNYGIVRRTNRYDDAGNLIEIKYWDKNGNPRSNEQGWASSKLTYKNGNLITEEFFDASGAPCLTNELIAKFVYNYNDQGNQTEDICFGVDGKPCLHKLGFAKLSAKYDERGNVTEFANFGIDGKPCQSSLGYSKNVRVYDAHDNLIEESFFGADGKPCLCPVGFAKITSIYDEKGNLIEQNNFGVDGKPCLDLHGGAKITLTYDKRGNVIEYTNFGIDGKPCLCLEGYATAKSKYYDYDRGNIAESAYFDTNGNPCLYRDLYAKITFEYDEWGNIKETAFFGIDNKLREIENGIAKITTRYDELGNMVYFKAYNANNQLLLSLDGDEIASTESDGHGLSIQTTFYNADGFLCKPNDACSKTIRKYKEFKLIEEAFFSIDTAPSLCENGYAKSVSKYDDRGNETEKAYFGADGKPCLFQNSYSRITKKYNIRGQETEIAYFGIDGKPCLYNNGYAKITMKYDESGNVTEFAHYGADGKLCVPKDGYAITTFKYDDRGHVIEYGYIGPDNKPCLHKDGYAKALHKFDEDGNILEITYLDLNGQPFQPKEDEAVEAEIKEKLKGFSLEVYLDKNEKRCLKKNAVVKARYSNDNNGRPSEVAYFDLDGKPCLFKMGAAKITYKHDAQGNLIELAFFGVDDHLCLCEKGFAKTTSQYDEQGNEIEKAYFGVDGQPCLSTEGASKVTWKFDKRGKALEQAFFGIDGQPCLLKDGYAKITWEYDKQGNETKITFYDEHGNEIPYYVSAMEVLPGSNGEKFGIKDGDFFILYDGQPVDNVQSFIDKRSKETGDGPHELVVLRDKEFIEIQIHPGKLGCSLGPRALSEDQHKLVLEKRNEVKKTE